jgi:hypothetical protein
MPAPLSFVQLGLQTLDAAFAAVAGFLDAAKRRLGVSSLQPDCMALPIIVAVCSELVKA